MITVVQIAVQIIWSVIHRQMILFPVQCKSRPTDTVRIRPYGHTKKTGIEEIIFPFVKAQNHISKLSVFIWHHKAYYRRTDICNLYFHAVLILQSIQINLFPRLHCPKLFFHNPHDPSSFIYVYSIN